MSSKDELALMVDIFASCIETRILPQHNSPCHQKARELVEKSGYTFERVKEPVVGDKYIPGQGCTCAAHDYSECGCGADWTPKVEHNVKKWLAMKDQEMRLYCGEMTAQEIRTVRAVLTMCLVEGV